MDSALAFILLSCHLVLIAGGKSDLKVCVVGNAGQKTSHTTKYCDMLSKSKRSPVSCVYAADRLSCLTAVSRRKADFSVFEAEDLYVSKFLEDASILVVGEIREQRKKAFHYGAVAVVRKDSNVTGLSSLRGKRLCHPGLDTSPEWSNLFAQYLEERVAPANCDEGLTIYEDRIKTTSEFFGSACKAGPWAPRQEEDARLKKNYWNLCSLCDSGTCGNSEKYRGSGGSITCLKDGVGDILWIRDVDINIHRHFLDGDGSNSLYQFLCDDGKLIPFATEEPCVWLARPWQVIGANRKSAIDVQKIIDVLADEVLSQGDWQQNLIHVIELYLEYIDKVTVSRTPEDYLRGIPGYLSASVMSEGNCKPDHSVKLCVSSAIEKQKCFLISKAASSLGIQPSLDCVRKMNFTACLNSVSKRETDVVIVSPDYLSEASMVYNLKSFLFETGSSPDDGYLVSAVVKKNSGMKNVEDLRGKKVCFTRRNGIGWKSAVSVLSEEDIIDSECGDHEGLSEFFGGICVARQADDEDLAACCPNLDEEESDEMNVLRCLEKGGCDVAIVDVNSLKRIEDNKNQIWWKDSRPSDFRNICRSEKSKDCHWMRSHPNYIMTYAELTSPKGEETFNLFYELGQYFGKTSRKKTSMMRIFGTFQKVDNVLFRDTSTSFVAPSSAFNLSNSYLETLNRMRLCSGSPLTSSSLGLVLASAFFLRFIMVF